MSLKNIAILLVLGTLVAGVVWYSFLRDNSAPKLLVTEDLTASSAIDSDVVAILLQLRAVSLAGTIFTDPVFMSLRDYGSQIIPEPVGRENPFAPLKATSTTSSLPGTINR